LLDLLSHLKDIEWSHKFESSLGNLTSRLSSRRPCRVITTREKELLKAPVKNELFHVHGESAPRQSAVPGEDQIRMSEFRDERKHMSRPPHDGNFGHPRRDLDELEGNPERKGTHQGCSAQTPIMIFGVRSHYGGRCAFGDVSAFLKDSRSPCNLVLPTRTTASSPLLYLQTNPNTFFMNWNE
jgi:hypothetical protein